MIKIQGRSFTKEFVKCNHCGKDFVWLKGCCIEKGIYLAICARCKKEVVVNE